MRGVPVYLPPAFFWWWYAYDAYAPRVFIEGAIIVASGGFISIAVAIGMSVWRAREAKNVETYGSARWATAVEVRGAGLLRTIVDIAQMDLFGEIDPDITGTPPRSAAL